jgi:hypothetical protein
LENELPHSDTSGGSAAIAMPQLVLCVVLAYLHFPDQRQGHRRKVAGVVDRGDLPQDRTADVVRSELAAGDCRS